MIAYELVKASYRKTVDLRKFTAVIRESILDQIPEATVIVKKDMYIITDVPYDDLPFKFPRKIGENLASHKEFWPYIVEYRDDEGEVSSRQLFRRKENIVRKKER